MSEVDQYGGAGSCSVSASDKFVVHRPYHHNAKPGVGGDCGVL